MISRRIDRWVEMTKWPAAVLAVASWPLTTYAWGLLLAKIPSYPFYSLMFGAGVLAVVCLARTSIARSTFVLRLIEIERDITQSILAFAMLHPVVGFGENLNKGSRVRWLGRGNWIMLAAPYFIPTAAIAIWVLSLILFQSLRSLALGFGISYHVIALVVQFRNGSSELRRLGKRFCWMFLPAMNFLIVGCAAAFALNGFAGIGEFLYDSSQLPSLVWRWSCGLFVSKSSLAE
jgi:hypothetical protein